jgi:predicted aldo/keto reductase-like oxidoreductase
MQYSVLGTTGVKVSRVCLGTATLGVAPTTQDADRVVGGAIDLGINFVDTAGGQPGTLGGGKCLVSSRLNDRDRVKQQVGSQRSLRITPPGAAWSRHPSVCCQAAWTHFS